MLCRVILFASLATSALALQPNLGPLLAAHCVDCHGADVQKGGLRLDGDVSMEAWIKVHDKLVAGEMPPKDEAQPPPALRAESIRSLHGALHTASLLTVAKVLICNE
jgi:Planctomycete cytochrome C